MEDGMETELMKWFQLGVSKKWRSLCCKVFLVSGVGLGSSMSVWGIFPHTPLGFGFSV